MNKKSNKIKNIFLFIGALSIPYIYFMTIRPLLVSIEKSLDNKITNISDKELDRMKKKMEIIKATKEENRMLSDISNHSSNTKLI
jgi:hypothetical protein